MEKKVLSKSLKELQRNTAYFSIEQLLEKSSKQIRANGKEMKRKDRLIKVGHFKIQYFDSFQRISLKHLKIIEYVLFYFISWKIVIFNFFGELQQNCTSASLQAFQAKS